MWISVETGEVAGAQEQPQIRLPHRFCRRMGLSAPCTLRLRYGAGEMAVTAVVDVDGSRDAAGDTPEAPARVVVSPAVIQRLHVRTEPVYRLRPLAGGVEIGPVLGLCLGNRNHWYDHAYLHREPERVTDVYPYTGGLFCAFSPRNLSLLDRCAYGLFYHPAEQRWRFGVLPLPAVVHRRSFHNSPATVNQLLALPGITVFNSRRFSKWELYQILSPDPTFSAHLPETAVITAPATVLDMAHRHGAVILKPADLSRGRGIAFVERVHDAYRLIDYRQAGTSRRVMVTATELASLLDDEFVGRRYLCQQKINLATIDGAPFDIRVVMQRDPTGNWVCNGIECRLARKGDMVTNIAFGARALTLDQAVRTAFGAAVTPEQVEVLVTLLGRRFCHLLDQTGETFAEFGVDLALDQWGKAWFIEANVLPTFRGFQALDPAIYRKLLAAPLLYASYRAGFGDGSSPEVAAEAALQASAAERPRGHVPPGEPAGSHR